jgi:hypothetical protein
LPADKEAVEGIVSTRFKAAAEVAAAAAVEEATKEEAEEEEGAEAVVEVVDTRLTMPLDRTTDLRWRHQRILFAILMREAVAARTQAIAGETKCIRHSLQQSS